MTNPPAHYQNASLGPRRDSLADILERVLDKGLVIAGDVRVNLCDVELLTLKVRLLLASVDTAQKMGIDWWQHDPYLTTTRRGDRVPDAEEENRALKDRVERLESQLQQFLQSPPPHDPRPHAAQETSEQARTSAET